MKKYLLFILMIGCHQLFAQKEPLETFVSGYVPDLKDSVAQVKVKIFSPTDLKNPVSFYKTKVLMGKFKIGLPVKKLSIVSIAINEYNLFFIPTTHILLEPGDQINIEIPDFKKLGLYDLKFSGKGSEKIELEKKVYSEILAIFKKDKPTAKQSVTERYETTYRKRRAADSVLLANKKMVDNITYQFLIAHHTDEAYDMLLYAMKHKEVDNDSYKRLFHEYIIDKKVAGDIIPAIKAQTFTYSQTLRDIALLSYAYDNNIMVDSIQKNADLYFKVIFNYYGSEPTIRDFILANLSYMQMPHDGLTKQVQTFVDNYLASAPSGSIYRPQVEELKYRAEINLAKGRDAYNFQLEKSDGKTVKLSDYLGKVVVIDFWFTGCVNCKVMKPLMENIEEQFKEKPIAFLSVSIDADKLTWKKMGIGVYSSKTAVQLFTNGLGAQHPMIEKYMVKGYPKLVIIDKEGKINNANAQDPRYDYEKLVAQIYAAIK